MKRTTAKVNTKPLDQEEKELEESLEKGEWKSIPNTRQILREHSQIFRNAQKKNKNINIRVTESDFDGIRGKALEEGIPYQTLISSLIHKYISGKLTPSS